MYSTHLARNTLSLRNVQRARKRLPRMFCAHCAPEPTPSPSQEGSNIDWPVPLLGGVRGGLVGARFMDRRALERLWPEISFALMHPGIRLAESTVSTMQTDATQTAKRTRRNFLISAGLGLGALRLANQAGLT